MSYTLKYTGAEIDDILDRAVEGGAIDEELALKAPLESPALTGTPTAPTPAESDNSTKVATTAYADRAAAGAAAAAYPVDTASGAIASFADGADSIPMKSFVCSIDPIQNLNGQSAPYPAGGGKNKWSNGDLDQSSGVGIAYALPAGTYTISAVRSASNLNLGLRFNYADTTSTAFTLNDNTKFAGYTFTLTQDCVSFNFSIANYVSGAKITNIQIESGSSATAYAPYSNVCPIYGNSGVTGVVTGENVWDEQTELGNYNTASGAKGTSSTNLRCVNPIPVRPNTTYQFSSAAAAVSKQVFFYDARGTYLGYQAIAANSATFTTPNGCTSMAFFLGSGYGTTYNNDVSINYPSDDTSYHAYSGQTYPVTFYDGDNPLEVYKGYIDLVSGVLTVTHKGIDLATLTWNVDQTYGYFFSPVQSDAVASATVMAEKYKSVSAADIVTGSESVGIALASSKRIIARTGSADEPTGLAVYPLETPIDYHLTTTEVLSLLGRNNCFNDCGDTAVEYRADIALYVQKLLGGNVSTLSMSAPTPSLSLGRTGVLLEPEVLEPVITEDAEPDLAVEEQEEPEAVEEPAEEE